MKVKIKAPHTGEKNYKVVYFDGAPFAVNFDGIQVPTTHGMLWQCKISTSGSKRIAVVSLLVSLMSIALNIYLLCA